MNVKLLVFNLCKQNFPHSKQRSIAHDMETMKSILYEAALKGSMPTSLELLHQDPLIMYAWACGFCEGDYTPKARTC